MNDNFFGYSKSFLLIVSVADLHIFKVSLGAEKAKHVFSL